MRIFRASVRRVIVPTLAVAALAGAGLLASPAAMAAPDAPDTPTAAAAPDSGAALDVGDAPSRAEAQARVTSALGVFRKGVSAAYLRTSALPATTFSATTATPGVAHDVLDFYSTLGGSDAASGLTPTAVTTGVTVRRTAFTATGASVTADVQVDTTYSDGTDASFTDTHVLTVAWAGGKVSITDDRFLPPPSEEPKDSPDDGTPPATGPASTARPSSAVIPKAAPAAVAAASKPSQPKVNVSRMVDYALLWTDKDHATRMNHGHSFPDLQDNCANFVSQSLYSGGWKVRNGVNPKDSNNWAPNLHGPAGPSYTWSGAKFLDHYGYFKAQWGALDNIWNARPGGMMFMDWTSNGSIDHAVAVTGVTSRGEPRLSQKSSNRHNITMTDYLAIVRRQGLNHVTWYGLVAR